MNTETQTINVNGIQVQVVRKNIKNLHLGVYPPSGRVRVAAPEVLSNDAVRLAVVAKLGWIKRQQAAFNAQERQSKRQIVGGESHDFLGRRYGMPSALSGHQTFFLWGPRGYSGNCMIVLDDRREVLERLWEKVEYVGVSAGNPYALEQNIPVFICKKAKFGTFDQLWPAIKKWR